MPSLRHPFPALALGPLALLAFAACGSEVTTSTGGGGTGGGTGAGSSTTGTTSTGGSGGAPGCPASQPGFGQPCAVAGQTCSYGDGCCPSQFQCDGSVWQALVIDCAPPVACPVDPPATGDACDGCFEPGPCTYPCPGTSAQISASCGGGAWFVDGTCPVPPPVDCGGTPCKPGDICVQSAGGIGFSYGCAPDPCFPAQLSCGCAAALCGGAPYQCDAAMGQELFCSCPTCP